MLSVAKSFMLNVVILSVVMLSVVAPLEWSLALEYSTTIKAA